MAKVVDRLSNLVRDKRQERSSAAEVAAGALRDLIMEGELGPGTQLSEEAYLEPLGVSRNTLREAFRLLAHEKLLVHHLNRGVFVRSLDATDIADLYRVRRMIEIYALGRADHEGIEMLHETVLWGERAAEDGRWVDVGTASIRFHQAVAALAGSPRVDEIMRQIGTELRLGFHEMGNPRDFHEGYLRRNRKIVGALQSGDRTGAARQLESYLDDAEKEMLAAFAKR